MSLNAYLTIDPDATGSAPAVTLTHDANGNLTQDPTARNAGDGVTPTGQKYDHHEENRLTAVRRASGQGAMMLSPGRTRASAG